jgi:D-alanyl-D-alanine carboxypeptidase (penicillin-binding protein 5/6)
VGQNELYHMRYRGEIGAKNGWTRAARQTFTAAATRGKRTLVVTLMYNEKGIAKQAKALLDWGFSLPAKPTTLGTLVPPRSVAAKKAVARVAPEAAPEPGTQAVTRVAPEAATEPGTDPVEEPVTVAPGRAGAPAPAAGAPVAEDLPVQASLSLGAIGFAGFALFPRRRPRPVAVGDRGAYR